MPTLEEIESRYKAMVPPVRIGMTVRYFTASGDAKSAVITKIQDAGLGKVKLAVLSEDATWASVDNVVWSVQAKASSWQAFDASVDRLS